MRSTGGAPREHDRGRLVLNRLDRKVIDPHSPTPLYFQLYSMLHDAIAAGEFPSGARMPSEKELASSYGVSRITARRALGELALKKMVARHRGRGTFVDYRYQPDPIHAPLTDFMQSIDHMWRDTRVEVVELDFREPPESLGSAFGRNARKKLCYQVRVRSKQDVPFAHYVAWTAGLGRRVTKKRLETTPRIELFRDHDIRISRVEQYLSAEGALPQVARLLGIATGKPLLKLVRYSYHQDGSLLDLLTALYNPDLFVYKMETTL
jgi:GntR family transcriptional regulator